MLEETIRLKNWKFYQWFWLENGSKQTLEIWHWMFSQTRFWVFRLKNCWLKKVNVLFELHQKLIYSRVVNVGPKMNYFAQLHIFQQEFVTWIRNKFKSNNFWRKILKKEFVKTAGNLLNFIIKITKLLVLKNDDDCETFLYQLNALRETYKITKFTWNSGNVCKSLVLLVDPDILHRLSNQSKLIKCK